MAKSIAYRFSLGLGMYALALGAVLSIAQLPGDWGHSICGPWGCGPPLQALFACHLAWMVLLVPLATMLVRSPYDPAHLVRRLGVVLCVAAVVSVAAVLLHERLSWWPSVNEWQRGYFWQRCGFVLTTTVDFPVAQILLIGIYLAIYGRNRM